MDKQIENILNQWTEKLHQKTEEQKLSLLIKVGEGAFHFLLNCKVIKTYEVINGQNPRNYTRYVELENENQSLTYYFTQASTYNGHIENSTLKTDSREALEDFLNTLHLGRIQMQIQGYLANKHAYETFFNHFDYPVVDIHYINSKNDETYEISVYDKTYVMVPKEKRDTLAREKIETEFAFLEINESPGDDSPVSWLEELTGVPTSEILASYQNVANEGMEPHLSEDDALEFLEAYFGVERYLEKTLNEKGYNGIFGRVCYQEEAKGDYFLYQSR